MMGLVGMNKEIVKTVVHLKDDKGWEQVLEFDGDKVYGNTYRIRRRSWKKDVPTLIPKFAEKDHPQDHGLVCRDYEFDLVNARWNDVDDKKVEKHLWFEMS